MIENEKVEELFLELEEKCDKCVSSLEDELGVLRAGRANPQILDRLMVEAYGGTSRLVELGNVTVQDARNLIITLWDKSLLKAVEKAILQSNIGITPTNDGKIIRLTFPEMTEETRRDMVKRVRKMGEDGKVSVRNVRREAMDKIKKMKTGKELSEDEASLAEAEVEKTVKSCMEKVEKAIAAKEKDIMTI